MIACPDKLRLMRWGGRLRSFPNTRPQALIDKLVITGLCALTWKLPEPPKLWGNDRDRWALPEPFDKVLESAKD